MTTKMSRLMVILVLGLMTSVIVARNVESEKEKKVDDVEKEDGEEAEKKRTKRETNDLLEQEWKAFTKQRMLDNSLKELNKEAVAEFFAERKKKFEDKQQIFERICTCHTFRKTELMRKSVLQRAVKL